MPPLPGDPGADGQTSAIPPSSTTHGEAADSGADLAALPAATSWRFVLLMAAVIAGAIALNTFLVTALLGAFPRFPLLSQFRCYTGLAADVAARRPGYGMNFYSCLIATQSAQALANAGLAAVLVVISVLIYRLYPPLILRRATVRPLAALAGITPVRVIDLIDMVTREAGRPVELLVAVDQPGTGARAFGCFPRYRILMDIGLVTVAGRDEGRLRAVLAHEVGHVRNRDIDITYLTTAVWWAFLAVELPLSAVAAIRLPSQLLGLSWRLAIILALIWLVRSSVLRTREFYADLAAAADPLAREPLRQALQRQAPSASGSRPRPGGGRRLPLAALLSRASDALAYHPPASDRLAILADQSPLYRAWPADALIAGALIGIAYSPLNALFALLDVSYTWRLILLGIIVGLAVGGTLAGPLWRQSYQQLSLGQQPRGSWRCSVSFATGILIGQLVTPPLSGVNGLAAVLREQPLVGLALIGVLYLVTYLMFEWIVLGAETWLAVARPRSAYRAGVVLAALVTGVWLSYWFDAQTLVLETDTPWRVLELKATTIPVTPYLVVSLALAFAFPAAAWRPRPTATGGPRSTGVPLIAALVLAVVIMAAATVIPFGFGGYVRAAYRVSLAQGDGQIVMLAILRIFTVISGVAGLAAGAVLGRRYPVRQVAAAAGLAALVAAPYAVWMTIFHLFFAADGSGKWLIALDYAPEHASSTFRPLLGWWFTDLSAACIVGAVLGAGATAVLGQRRRRVPSGDETGRAGLGSRPRSVARRLLPLAAVAVLLPVLAIAGVLFYAAEQLSGTGAPPVTTTIRNGPTSAQVIQAAARRASPYGSIPVETACGRVTYAALNFPSGNELDTGQLYVMLAETAVYAHASNDYLLANLGVAIARAMAAGDVTQASHLTSAAVDYCNVVRLLPRTA
jgi:Zn-dependent protease with chaperone function